MAIPEETTRLLGGPNFPDFGRNNVTLEDLNTIEVPPDVPSLQAALEAWQGSGDNSALVTRALFFECAQIPISALTLLHDECKSNHLPFAVVTHKPSFSAGEKAEILISEQVQITRQTGSSGPVLPLKTLTFKTKSEAGPEYFLLTRVGNFQITSETEDQLAETIGISRKAVKKGTINPKEFDTASSLGLIPGIVSPFFEPHHVLWQLAVLCPRISEVIYLDSSHPPETLVGIAATPIDTLVMPQVILEKALDLWELDRIQFMMDLINFFDGKARPDMNVRYAGYLATVAKLLADLRTGKETMQQLPEPESTS